MPAQCGVRGGDEASTIKNNNKRGVKGGGDEGDEWVGVNTGSSSPRLNRGGCVCMWVGVGVPVWGGGGVGKMSL